MKAYKRKLTSEQVAEIRRRHELRKKGCPKTMAKEYGVHVTVIRQLIYGNKLSEEQKRDILRRWELREQGAPKVLAQEFGVNTSHIQRIVNWEIWRESDNRG